MFQFLFAGFLAVFCTYISQYDKRNLFLRFAFFIIWYIAAFQDSIGTDFSNYINLFDRIQRGEVSPALFRTDRDQVEVGWYILNKSIGKVFDTFYAVTPIVYAIILYPIYKLVKLSPKQYRWIAVFYFFFGVKWFIFDMTGQRQGVAIAFWSLLVFSLKDKQYSRAVIYTILGISFHNSFIYSLVMIPIIWVPFDKINVTKHRVKWIIFVTFLFTMGLFYVSKLVESIQLMATFIEGSANEEVYLRYIQEVQVHERSITNFIAGLILILFITIAYTSKKNSMKDVDLFFAVFIIIFVLEASIGNYGSLPRIFRYVGFLSLPAISFTAYYLKGTMRYLFIFYLLFSSLYSFNAIVHTEQYEAYLQYHTIFF